MSMTEAVNSWRQLADQLTAEQIAELEEYEQNPPTFVDLSAVGCYRRQTAEELRDSLLDQARRHAKNNLADAFIGPVALPPGFNWASDWQEGREGGAGLPHRCVYADRDSIDGRLRLSATAIQFADSKIDAAGDVEAPHIDLIWEGTDTDVHLSSAAAREAATALLAIADEIDGCV